MRGIVPEKRPPVGNLFIRGPGSPAHQVHLLWFARCAQRHAGVLILRLQPEFDAVGKRFELVPPDKSLKSIGMDFERRRVPAELFEFEGAIVVGHRRSI